MRRVRPWSPEVGDEDEDRGEDDSRRRDRGEPTDVPCEYEGRHARDGGRNQNDPEKDGTHESQASGVWWPRLRRRVLSGSGLTKRVADEDAALVDVEGAGCSEGFAEPVSRSMDSDLRRCERAAEEARDLRVG